MFTPRNISRIKSITVAAVAALSFGAAAGAGTASAITKPCTNPLVCSHPEVTVITELVSPAGAWFGGNKLFEHMGAKTFSVIVSGHEEAGGTITTNSSGASELVFARGLREKIKEVELGGPGELSSVEYVRSTISAAGSVITVGAHYSGACGGEGWHAAISPAYSQAEHALALVQKEEDFTTGPCDPK